MIGPGCADDTGTLALNPGTLMGYNPTKEGDIKDVVATFALYDTGVVGDHGVQFYRVTEPWRSPEEVGASLAESAAGFIAAHSPG